MNIIKSIPEVNDEDKRYFHIAGEYYGYPKCCINFFIQNWGKGVAGFTDAQKKVASNHFGFIPCQCHAVLINKGLPIPSVLTNRVCNTPFPEDGKYSDFEYFVDNYDKVYNPEDIAFITQPRQKEERTLKRKSR